VQGVSDSWASSGKIAIAAVGTVQIAWDEDLITADRT